MKRILPGVLLILVLCSHDMFLKMDSFFIQPNTDTVIKLFNGTFDKSENVIARNRMLDVSLFGNGNRIEVDSSQWYEKDSITYLQFKAGEEGTWVAGLSTAPRNIELEANAFNDYLKHDGVLDEIQRRTENGDLDKDAIERYSKHVKTIFQVGETLSDDWNTVLGYPIEFVPLENPYDIHPGHDLQVKLLLDGNPLSNQLIYVGNTTSSDGHSQDDNAEHTHEDGTTHTHDETGEESVDHEHTGITQLRTDENGVISVDITSTGEWYLRTIHMVRLEEEGLTHESKWATLTFAIGEGHTHDNVEAEHQHEDEGIPSYLFWIGSLILIGILFFWFNRKK